MPEDPYGISKAEAEEVVLAAHAAGFIEAIIIRPVLVYEEGAKENLERLLSAIAHGRLLTVGGIRNRRSMIGVGNLLRPCSLRQPLQRFGLVTIARMK